MQHRTCGECLFYDICEHHRACSDFCPTDESQFDVDEIIETGRQEFYKEWFVYISEND